MNIKSDFDFLIKMALLGDSSVGKSNMVLRFTDDVFSLNMSSTIGYDYKSRNIVISKKTAKLQIWDTAGQERYMSLCKSIYQKVDGVMLVYDITQLETFQNIKKWIDVIKGFNDNLPMMLVGNKIDKEEERIISVEDGKNLANEYGMQFIETSALSGNNIEKAFVDFGKEILEYLKNKMNLTSNTFSIASNRKNKDKNKKKCCKNI